MCIAAVQWCPTTKRAVETNWTTAAWQSTAERWGAIFDALTCANSFKDNKMSLVDYYHSQ